MRSLEIRTERIFNNLIKQNQKLAADFVLKQSKIVSSAQSSTSSVKIPEFSALSSASSVQRPEFSVHSLTSRVQSPTSRVQRPASRVQLPESSVQSPASRVQSPESRVQRPESRVQLPESSVQSPESSVQSPASNSCVQSPGIPVCLLYMTKHTTSSFTRKRNNFSVMFPKQS